MKLLRLFALLLLVIQSVPTRAQAPDDEETKAAIKEFQMTEAELNGVFSKILAVYKADTEFIKNIKESQDLWKKFRTAELKAKFPERGPGAYGDPYTMCFNDYMTEMTRQRTTDLKIWLKGTFQGDVCSGSVRINE